MVDFYPLLRGTAVQIRNNANKSRRDDAARGASLLSRGAAAECSPGQRPGIRCVLKMSHGVAKEGLGIFRTYRCSCLPRAQLRALPGARLCRRSAALVGRRLMRNYFGQHCLRGEVAEPFKKNGNATLDTAQRGAQRKRDSAQPTERSNTSRKHTGV